MKRILFLLLVAVLLTGCSSESGEGDLILKSGDKTQIVYADETTAGKGDGITFTAAQPWKATVSEVKSKSTETGRVEWLELSAYEGGAGEFTLTITLQPNYTGADRKAIISIVCGDTTITITVEQKGTKQDGTIPEPDATYTGKLITKIETTNYCDGEIDSVEPETLVISYDEKGRVVKMVDNSKNDTSEGTCEEVVVTANFTYGANSVAYEIECRENNVVYETGKGDVTLDAKGRAVSGQYAWIQDGKDDGSAKYQLAYDTDGYLKVMTTTSVDYDGKEIDEKISLTWTDGNLIEALWENYSTLDKAVYGKVANKANLDLNWLEALDTEVFCFSVGDPERIFAALGYVGKRTENLAEQVYDGYSNVTDPYFEYKYEVDADGYVTTITTYEYRGSGLEKASVRKITYSK